VNHAWIRQLAKIAHPRLMPDLTLLFDAPPAVTSARVLGRGNRPDRFEAEGPAFFERVRQAYLDIATREPARVKLIDARPGEREVAAAVARALDAAFPTGGR
jgi:dTMP kinase